MNNLFYQSNFSVTNLQLNPEESYHIIKVLRYKSGDDIHLTDGQGNLFHCQLVDNNPKSCLLKILTQENKPKPDYFIHIALSPTKSSDRTEWFVEKAVEIGIQKISFIQTSNGERDRVNIERINKVAVAAMKQSHQLWLPEMEGMIPFHEILKSNAQQKFIASAIKKSEKHLSLEAKKNSSYLVLIGPEGDFTPDELEKSIDAGFSIVSLGNSILRTETAGIVACHILNLAQQI